MNKADTFQLPDWFDGQVYDEGETVTNPFSGEEYTLNNLELSMYDFIMGSQMVFEVSPNLIAQKQIDEFHKALKWFQETNSEAYKILLDQNMSGEDIIQRINEIKELIVRNPDEGDLALKYCDYLIDDIYLYRKQCL